MKRLIIVIVITAALGLSGKVSAKEQDFFHSLYIDKSTIVKGYTAKTPDGLLTLGILPGTLNKESRIEFKNLSVYTAGLNLSTKPAWLENLPKGWELISDIYEFNIINKNSFSNKKPLILELAYNKDVNNLKKLYFWNGVKKEWQPLPSQSLNDKNYIRSFIHLPYARLAIFANSNILEVGQASWYRYRGCDCAASPDYPEGSVLRVINLETDKSVIVKVNDYGPDRSRYPERAIDLDKTAFHKLAHLSQGIIHKVKVELISKSD